MTKFFNKFKKPYVFPIFRIFPKNLALLCTTSYRFLALYQNLERTNDLIARKCPDKQKDGRTDQESLFYRTLPVTVQQSCKLGQWKDKIAITNYAHFLYFISSRKCD